MLVYQRDNSTGQDHIQIDIYQDFQFFPHFHRDLEFFLVLEGEIEVMVRGRTESARPGEMGLIFSNEVHTYHTPQTSRVLICPFSGSLVSSFMRETEGLTGTKTVVPCGEALAAYIISCYQDEKTPDKLTLKGSLYALCARYLQCAPLTERKKGNDELLHRLLTYVEENYRENITMKSAAKEIGYDENYLSRYFHQMVGMNFRRFVNQYRIEYACNLIEEDSMRLSDIALECGFQNIRSFNRAFMDTLGDTPSAYARSNIQGKK